MIGLNLKSPDNSATELPAAKITAATYHQATGRLALTYTDVNGVSTVTNIQPPEAFDLYTALNSIKSGTYSIAT